MPSTSIKASGHKAANGAPASASASTSHNQSSSSKNTLLKTPNERPWVHKEDAVLLRYMAQYCDLKEKGMKVAGWFRRNSTGYGAPGGPPKDYDDILRRCQRLQTEHHKYELIVESPRVWPTNQFRRIDMPLWNFDHVEAARRYKAIWEDDLKERTEDASVPNDRAQAYKKLDEEAGEESKATKGGNQKQVTKQSEAVVGSGAQTSSSSEQDEAEQGQQEDSSRGAESETGVSSSESSEAEDEEEEDAGVEDVSHVSSSSQPQHHENHHAGEGKKSTSQNTRSLKRKREQTLLFESAGKRVRIGIPPKGTKVTYFPTNGSIQMIF